MSRCGGCGAPLQAGMRFCTSCGTAVPAVGATTGVPAQAPPPHAPGAGASPAPQATGAGTGGSAPAQTQAAAPSAPLPGAPDPVPRRLLSGEQVLHAISTTPHMAATDITHQLALTSQRVVGRRPHLVLGPIVLGEVETSAPLSAVRQVTVGPRIRTGRLRWGLVAVLLGLLELTGAGPVGVLTRDLSSEGPSGGAITVGVAALVLGIALLASAFRMALVVDTGDDDVVVMAREGDLPELQRTSDAISQILQDHQRLGRTRGGSA